MILIIGMLFLHDCQMRMFHWVTPEEFEKRLNQR
jgi:hypothetical protein